MRKAKANAEDKDQWGNRELSFVLEKADDDDRVFL